MARRGLETPNRPAVGRLRMERPDASQELLMRLLTSESQVAAAYGDCGVGGGLGLGLMSLSGTPKALSDPNQAGWARRSESDPLAAQKVIHLEA